MSIFQHTVRPFEQDEKDDDDDDDIQLISTTKASKIKSSSILKKDVKKRKWDDDDLFVGPNKSKSSKVATATGSKTQEIIVLEDDDIVEINKPNLLPPKPYVPKPSVIPSKQNPSLSDDNDLIQAEALLNKINATKSLLSQKSIPKESNIAETISIDDDSYVPQVQVYNSRLKVPSSSSSEFKLSDLQSLIGITVTNSISADPTFIEEEVGEKVKIKTRLNGKHEWKWKVLALDTFKKFKLKYSQVYGISENDIKLILDGESLTDTATCKSMDIEDDTLIEVKIAAHLYEKAVESAKNFSSRPAPVSNNINSNVNTNTQAVEEEVGEKVKIKTRLNGKHEWKWKVLKSDTFLKIKGKFSQVYGVSDKDVKFILDGDVIKDSATCESMDIDDDTLIEVKIAAPLYDTAVESAKNFQSRTTASASSLKPSTSASNPATANQIVSSTNLISEPSHKLNSATTSTNVPMNVNSIGPTISSTASQLVLSTANSIAQKQADMISINIDVFASERGGTGSPRLLKTSIVSMKIPKDKKLKLIKKLLADRGLVPQGESPEFLCASSNGKPMDYEKTFSNLAIKDGDKLSCNPAKLSVIISPHFSITDIIRTTQPTTLILRYDYEFSFVARSIATHFKINLQTMKFSMNDNEVSASSFQKTMRELGVKENQVITLSKR